MGSGETDDGRRDLTRLEARNHDSWYTENIILSSPSVVLAFYGSARGSNRNGVRERKHRGRVCRGAHHELGHWLIVLGFHSSYVNRLGLPGSSFLQINQSAI